MEKENRKELTIEVLNALLPAMREAIERLSAVPELGYIKILHEYPNETPGINKTVLVIEMDDAMTAYHLGKHYGKLLTL